MKYQMLICLKLKSQDIYKSVYLFHVSGENKQQSEASTFFTTGAVRGLKEIQLESI